jgi:retron-type reverse transcriptase
MSRFFIWLFSSLARLLEKTGAIQKFDPHKPPEPEPAPKDNWPAQKPQGSQSAASTPSTPVPMVGMIPPEAYDVTQYAPLSQNELQTQAGQLGPMWSSPWFGRQDLIPPADDPRTLFIDRAMVTHGFITPEELSEIHEIGAEMDAIRPRIEHAGFIAQRAVQQTEKARADLKQQKKAEALERKRQREIEIANRRATDIVFLGRGVSKGLADRRANIEVLQRFQLPILATPADVAKALGLSIPKLRWLAFHCVASQRTHYIRFSVPKKSGGLRELAKPHKELDRSQRWILANILEKIPVHPAAHGFVAGRSTVTGAAIHTNQAAVINCDLEDFFPSITFPRVMGFFRRVGYSPAVATILALLCTECPRRTVSLSGVKYHVATGSRGLPQGASTSPALSNLIAWKLDQRFAGLAKKFGCQYTRYADDLTFSGSDEITGKIGWFLAKVRHIAQDEGFRLNEKKTRVQRPHTAQVVTGLIVNERPGVPRNMVRRLRAILHRAKFEGLEKQNREGRPNFKGWVEGMVAYVHMANPKQGEPLKRALEMLG